MIHMIRNKKNCMRNILIILFSLLVWQNASTQIVGIQQVDSLRRELAVAKQDTSRAVILADLAEAYRSENPDSSMLFAQEALQLSRNINFPFGEMRAYLVLCYHFQFIGVDLIQALDVGLKAVDITQKYHFKTYEAGCSIRVGQVYVLLNDLKKAFNYFQRANQLSSNGGHPFFYAVTYWWMAQTYLNMNKLDSALYMAKIGYDKGIEINNNKVLGAVLRIMGTVYAKKGDQQLALQYYHEWIAASKKIDDLGDIVSGYIRLATFFNEQGQKDSALYYSKKGYELAEPRPFIALKMATANLLSRLLETDNSAEALRYLKIANAARDSIYNTQKLQSAQVFSFKEKERQFEMNFEKMAYRSRFRQYALLVGIGLLLIIMIGLYRNNRRKQKTNLALEKEKTKVEETLTELRSTQSQLVQREKMASLGEMTAGIAHEIQNPLNFVNNFSDVNRELVDELKGELATGNTQQAIEIADDIKANEEKINHHGKRADAIVKGMLQHSRSSTGQKESTDINALCDEYLRLAYHGLRAKDKSFNASTKTEFDSNIGNINVVQQDLGRVILNLINNAFYAVDEKKNQNLNGYEPTVTVATTKQNGKVEVKVADNGNGIPQKVLDKIFQPFFTTKPTGQGTGLGLSLAYDIIKAHGGEIKVNTKEGEGSEFIIQL